MDDISAKDEPLPTFTLRSAALGLAIGVVICLSNVYYGLQTGDSEPDGIAVRLNCRENVHIQTVAGAVGSFPLTTGLIGFVPAAEYLLRPSEGGPLNLTAKSLVLWSFGLCFFGVFFAVIFRNQFLDCKELPFPTPSAAAKVIKGLHRDTSVHDGRVYRQNSYYETEPLIVKSTSSTGETDPLETKKLFHVVIPILISGTIAVLGAFYPILHQMPFLGSQLANKWLWTVNLSPGIFGQGMITGPVISLHMLAGTVVGWAILSPLAKLKNWAPGPVENWDDGSRGWILWITLSTILADCSVNLLWMVINLDFVHRSLRKLWIPFLSSCNKHSAVDDRDGSINHDSADSRDEASTPVSVNAYTDLSVESRHESRPAYQQQRPAKQGQADTIPNVRILLLSLSASTILCIAAVTMVFPGRILITQVLLAIVISFFLSIMGIRAQGQTDFNPVSGLAQLSQFLFALVISKSNPDRMTINLIAGAIAEAGAGVMISDLKTGSIIGADPGKQLFGHIIGAVFGSLISVLFYKLYAKVYEIPGPFFQVPTAFIWLSAARLAYGAGLPPFSKYFSITFGMIFIGIALVKIKFADRNWIHRVPGGIAFATGMYNTPAFVIPKALGGIVFWYFRSRKNPNYLRLIAAGLILGESVFSLTGLFITVKRGNE